ncbi:MAG TPA: HEPN domain-containing protein [Thermoanaerobaculia bacterium]|nr:HEPN domain-containing protein [Thermoanaerobaculia bacterium]
MTPEVADHWQRAVQAIRTAEALVESDPDASASRAYYAAFHGISAFFALQGQTFTKHTAVERAVHRDLVKGGLWPVESGAAFSWLATLRYTGDYGGQEHVLPEDARTAVERARLILETVRSTAAEPLPELDT